MRNTQQLEQHHHGALLGQLLGAVVTIAVIVVVAMKVPDLMILILS